MRHALTSCCPEAGGLFNRHCKVPRGALTVQTPDCLVPDSQELDRIEIFPNNTNLLTNLPMVR